MGDEGEEDIQGDGDEEEDDEDEEDEDEEDDEDEDEDEEGGADAQEEGLHIHPPAAQGRASLISAPLPRVHSIWLTLFGRLGEGRCTAALVASLGMGYSDWRSPHAGLSEAMHKGSRVRGCLCQCLLA